MNVKPLAQHIFLRLTNVKTCKKFVLVSDGIHNVGSLATPMLKVDTTEFLVSCLINCKMDTHLSFVDFEVDAQISLIS